MFRLHDASSGGVVYDDVVITINAATDVSAGTDQAIALPTGTVTLPGYIHNITPGNATTWTQVSGPNTATFDNNDTDSTGKNNASYSDLIAGTYVFKLAELLAPSFTTVVHSDTVTVVVS